MSNPFNELVLFTLMFTRSCTPDAVAFGPEKDGAAAGHALALGVIVNPGSARQTRLPELA